jgi:hypothetical protein
MCIAELETLLSVLKVGGFERRTPTLERSARAGMRAAAGGRGRVRGARGMV